MTLTHLNPRPLTCLPSQIYLTTPQNSVATCCAIYRGIKPAILQQAERLKIIHLFYKYVSPKYQRDCRNNHRGKLLKKIRESKATHLKDEDWKMLVVESKGNIFPSLSTKSTVNNDGERLKPPPSCINTERKIIKLGSVSKTSSTGLDFLIIKKDDSEVSEDKESNKKQKLLKEKRKMQCEEETKMKKMKVDHEENEAVLSALLIHGW
ncbi:uncharacterized protein LOC123505615 isoform X3 [Portunus trituberculatus]|uniref:uncharacterized protein LOC123505615 isoform X3 n=1 Tax=Portunus trituberculatus TaxID=210409 RepID=UPI001E1CEDBF|nr:uncharacterized protein LOC123505615 isoform X3 [Portunus trituberculatus]